MLISRLITSIDYAGSPYHKRNPGDFGLTPPSQPRPDKSLCDEANIFSASIAKELLIEGVKKRIISEQERNGYPQNIWAVTEEGIPLEAQLGNEGEGTYHGYPMRKSDPLYKEILRRWNTV